jgi:hypothetical protein
LAVSSGLGRRQRYCKFYQTLVEDLLAFAEHHFRNGRKLADGATAAEHTESADRQFKKLGLKSKKPIVPVGPGFPSAVGYLWRWFDQLSMGLAISGMGPSAVTWEGLYAWSLQMRVELESWEALALIRIGYVRAVVLSEDPKKARPDGSPNENRAARKNHKSDRQ